MNDVAVYFEKIDLGEERYLFKPVNIIKGNYNKIDNCFITDYGHLCESINGEDNNYNAYFGFNTTVEELRNKFSPSEETSEDTLLSNYFDLISDYCYISYYDYQSNRLKTKQISYYEIEDYFIEERYEDKIKEMENFEEQKNEEQETEQQEVINAIALDIDSLNELRSLKNIKEVRKKIDIMVNLIKKLSEKNPTEKESSPKVITEKQKLSMSLKELRKEVLKNIIGQDKAVNDVTREIVMNQTSKDPRNKSHILITGPTGTGKTEIVKNISNLLTVPYFEADATAYTQEGYVGKSVYSMLLGLLEAADGNLEKAQNGILIIDEIDKKLSSRSDDVAGMAVLYSLLKIMERNKIELDKGSAAFKEQIMFDTSNLTIIFMGAFENIYNNKLNQNKKIIGFNSKTTPVDKRKVFLTKEDLIQNGLPIQFLGRIGDVTSTNFFTVKELEDILTKSQISPLLIQQQYFKESLGIDLRYTKGYINEIAKKANDRGTNARELKSLVKESLCEAFDDIIERKNASILRLTKKTVTDNKKYDIY